MNLDLDSLKKIGRPAILMSFIPATCEIIGVAVTVAKEEEFHAKATKKIKGAKTSLKLIKNASKVANICADVIGDVCGVLSGAVSAMISAKIVWLYIEWLYIEGNL